MTQYIKKSALVAEIERRRKDWHYGSSIEAKYKREECDDILSFLNTLEMKEVGLKKDFELTWKPTEEQLRELRCVISGCSFETPILVQLENDLKKLL
jgi:hypothetical protein